MTMYLATDVSQDPAFKGPDPDERLELVTMTFEEALALAKSGGFRDAKTILGVLAVDALARDGEVPELR
jgi:hypothetical protein